MIKTILGILSLSVMLSCSTAVKENTAHPDIMETNKKNLGNLLALYPKPMTVVGAEVEGKVNWLVVGHTGVIGHDRILVSMSKSHYTNQGIKKSKLNKRQAVLSNAAGPLRLKSKYYYNKHLVGWGMQYERNVVSDLLLQTSS